MMTRNRHHGQTNGSDARYDRQVRLFGQLGQRRIDAARAVVLGMGGLGMPLVQQMAYLGVRYFVVADSDTVGESNLNRLVGASVEDVGLYKVIVAERLIRAVQPRAEVTALMVDLPHDAISTAISRATVVVGCFDQQTPRLDATDVCSAVGVPYIDVATEVLPTSGGLIYGGRVVVAADGTGCVSCLEQRYHDDVIAPGGSGASVVTIEGVVASLAAMEIVCLLTGLRDPARYLVYRGELGTVERPRDPGAAGCPYCTRWRQRVRGGPER